MALISIHMRKVLWLKAWSAEAVFKDLTHMPFESRCLFVEGLSSKMSQEERFFFHSGNVKNPLPQSLQNAEHLNVLLRFQLINLISTLPFDKTLFPNEGTCSRLRKRVSLLQFAYLWVTDVPELWVQSMILRGTK